MAILVHCDYLADLRSLLADALAKDGFSVSSSDDPEAVLLKYLNVRLYRIPLQPRRVEWSRELRSKETAIAPGHRHAIDAIERTSISGGDLNPYVTRRLVKYKDADLTDLQYNDWGIRHLHLGDTFESPGVIKGTKELLFAIIRDDALYFIDLGDHNDWADERLFFIAEGDWPELFAHALTEWLDGDRSTAEQRLALRKRFSMATTTADGKVYLPAGGGQVTTGLNMEVRREADRVLTRVHELQDAHRHLGAEITAKIERVTGKRLEELHLQLRDFGEGGEVTVVETQTKLGIRSSRSIECESCRGRVVTTRDGAINRGWIVDPGLGWVCPSCATNNESQDVEE